MVHSKQITKLETIQKIWPIASKFRLSK